MKNMGQDWEKTGSFWWLFQIHYRNQKKQQWTFHFLSRLLEIIKADHKLIQWSTVDLTSQQE